MDPSPGYPKKRAKMKIEKCKEKWYGGRVWTILCPLGYFPCGLEIRGRGSSGTEKSKKKVNRWRGVRVEKIFDLVREIPYLATRKIFFHTKKIFFVLRTWLGCILLRTTMCSLRAYCGLQATVFWGRKNFFDFGGKSSIKILAKFFDPIGCPQKFEKNTRVSLWGRGGKTAKNHLLNIFWEPGRPVFFFEKSEKKWIWPFSHFFSFFSIFLQGSQYGQKNWKKYAMP